MSGVRKLESLFHKKRVANQLIYNSSILVRMKGLEPSRLTTLDPKSSAATNYATSA